MDHLIRFFITRFDNNEVCLHTLFLKLILFINGKEEFIDSIFNFHRLRNLWDSRRCGLYSLFIVSTTMLAFLSLDDDSLLGRLLLLFMRVIFIYIDLLCSLNWVLYNFFRRWVDNNRLFSINSQELIHLFLDIGLDEIVDDFQVGNNCLGVIFLIVVVNIASLNVWTSFAKFLVRFAKLLPEFLDLAANLSF